MVHLLATTSPSDEVAPIWWLTAWSCFALASVLSILAFGASLVARTGPWLGKAQLLARIAIVASIVPLGFSAYIHHIDFIAIDQDGTAASEPLWKTLIAPSLPVIASCSAMMIVCIRRGNTPATSSP